MYEHVITFKMITSISKLDDTIWCPQILNGYITILTIIRC